MFHKGVGNGINEIGPGKYENIETIKEKEEEKL